jgi:cation diffusion facilitator CzcD-associated flavoprotein CzcO
LPKEVMGYPDFPIPEQEKSYLPAKEILKFLNDYADNFGIRKQIKVKNTLQLFKKTKQFNFSSGTTLKESSLSLAQKRHGRSL